MSYRNMPTMEEFRQMGGLRAHTEVMRIFHSNRTQSHKQPYGQERLREARLRQEHIPPTDSQRRLNYRP